MHPGVGMAGIQHIRDHGDLPQINFNQLRQILGFSPRHGQANRDRFADMAHFFARQHRLR